ncbi:MAG TPA: hypothetical protein VKR83_05980 [Ktedonobacteraceae bacterium]|nr:hypothetical protein [Ktedonobacteraceae bacterium]
MHIRSVTLSRYCGLIALLLLLAACDSPTSGTPPAGTAPAQRDGSAVAQSTSTPAQVQSSTSTADTGSHGTPGPSTAPGMTYAFVRAGQVWVVINGASAVQATHFDYSSAGSSRNVFFGQPLWFASDRFLAFTLKVLPGGLGGGGCGFDSDYGRSGQLFVLDTTSMQLAQIAVPGEQSAITPGAPYNGYWEYLFSEDDSHLLAWHNDRGLRGAGGLYRYDLNAGTLVLTIPSSSVPGADNYEAWYPMRYSSGQLYYETMIGGGTNNTVFTIYSHSVSNPAMPGTKVLDVGSEPFCASQGNNPNSPPVSGPFREPGWDISPDGKYLAAQTMVTSGSTTTGSVKVVMLSTGTTLTLFAQAPAQVLDQDALLSWSHDGGAVVLKSSLSQFTLYSVLLSSPATMQTYSTSGVTLNSGNDLVHLVWQGDGGVFAMFCSQQFGIGSNPGCANAYEFIVGQPTGALLLANAYNFAWG